MNKSRLAARQKRLKDLEHFSSQLERSEVRGALERGLQRYRELLASAWTSSDEGGALEADLCSIERELTQISADARLGV